MGTTLCHTTHIPACVSSMMLNLLIRLVTEVIFFCADHKLWSKTSITHWANAISSQQPYNLHKQWVLPGGNEHHSGLRVINNEVFTKREQRRRAGGKRYVMMQPWCYQVIGLRLGWERKKVCYQHGTGFYQSGNLSVSPSLSVLYIWWTLHGYEALTLPEKCHQ